MKLFGKTKDYRPPDPEEQKLLHHMSEDELLNNMKEAIDTVNAIWAMLPRNYGIWIEWQHKPRRIVLTEGIYVTRDVVHPK